jgi:hypothetical protein
MDVQGVFLSTTSSMDVQGASLSTGSNMGGMQAVSLSTASSMFVQGASHGLIKTYRQQSKLTMTSSKKEFTSKGTLRQVFVCLRPPPLVGFCFGAVV